MSNENNLKVYYIDYIDDYDDLCHIWCEAESEEEARDYLYSEYHSIKEVIQIYEKRR